MIEDIVLDTNILKHASDPRQSEQRDIQKFLTDLQSVETKICLDEGTNLEVEGQNRGAIYGEYRERLVQGELGFELIAFLARNKRISFVSKGVHKDVAKVINKAVWDKTDRIFVKVAHNSRGKILTTRDRTNFPKKVCQTLKKKIGISVLDTAEAHALL